MCRSAWSFLLLVNFIVFAPLSAGAEKTDSIVLKNGDKITGEIISLGQGELTYKTDDMGTLTVEWEQISKISSKNSFTLENVSGARFYGAIQEASEPGKLVVRTESGPVTLDLRSVVRISQFAQKFFGRFQGYLDLGFSLQQANKNTQLNMAASITYLGYKWHFSTSASSYLSKQENVATTTKNDLVFSALRLFKKKWNGFTIVQGQQNEELNLALRVLAGLGIGRFFVQTNRQLLNASVGIGGTSEKYYDESSTQESVEAILALKYQAFRFASPKLNATATLVAFPSLTTAGRIRLQFQSQIRYELFSNFYVTLGLTDYYDSKPGEEGAAKNDYGVTLSISWSLD